MSANTSYQRNRTEIDYQLARLSTELEKLDNAQLAHERNWDYAGSAGHIADQVRILVDFLKGDE